MFVYPIKRVIWFLRANPALFYVTFRVKTLWASKVGYVAFDRYNFNLQAYNVAMSTRNYEQSLVKRDTINVKLVKNIVF